MPGLLLLVAALSTYFRVSNSYVQHKLRVRCGRPATKRCGSLMSPVVPMVWPSQVLIFPFRHKPWRRSAGTVSPDGHPVKSLPMGDVMAPDLYIPLMAFVTFILATGLIKGIGYKFHPEVLSNVMSSCVVGAIIEVGVLGVWLYILSVHDVGLVRACLPSSHSLRVRPLKPPPAARARLPRSQLDLVAYTGYKYVGLVLNACIGLALGKTAYFLVRLLAWCRCIALAAPSRAPSPPLHRPRSPCCTRAVPAPTFSSMRLPRRCTLRLAAVAAARPPTTSRRRRGTAHARLRRRRSAAFLCL